MEVQRYQENHRDALLAYWKTLGASVPYFFLVSPKRWQDCLLDDELDGDKLFGNLETLLATEKGQVLGFAQFGHPNFAWDTNGQRYDNPHIGVIRHFYFEKARLDVAEAMLARARAYLRAFPQGYAFYHILGMSCNAHHGKLHTSLRYIDEFLRKNGFEIEHENVYYSLEMNASETLAWNELRLVACPSPLAGIQDYEIHLLGKPIGSLTVRFLEQLTGGCTSDTAYLTWLGIEESCRGLGWGTRTLQLLVAELRDKGYRYLHTDTASTNHIARHLYERCGFQDRGGTRSYLEVRG
jgi:ribosomal protein S18 acetylase RimI-like enzyme